MHGASKIQLLTGSEGGGDPPSKPIYRGSQTRGSRALWESGISYELIRKVSKVMSHHTGGSSVTVPTEGELRRVVDQTAK